MFTLVVTVTKTVSGSTLVVDGRKEGRKEGKEGGREELGVGEWQFRAGS